MFDQQQQRAYAYSHDEEETEVVDVEPPPPPPTRSRVDTKDLTVHVHIDGRWHRLDPQSLDASCGAVARFGNPRRNERIVEHPLSRTCGCFTERELERADRA